MWGSRGVYARSWGKEEKLCDDGGEPGRMRGGGEKVECLRLCCGFLREAAWK